MTEYLYESVLGRPTRRDEPEAETAAGIQDLVYPQPNHRNRCRPRSRTVSYVPVTEYFYLGAYWGDRPEAVDDCARRLLSCLDGLAATHNMLGWWYPRGKPKAQAVESAPAKLSELLLAGRNRTDVGNKVIEELGFSVSLWNRDRSNPCVLSVHCGSHARTARIVNSCVVDLPPFEASGDASMDLLEPERASAMMRVVVQSWQPTWAVLTTDTLRNAQTLRPGAPYIGWKTYLADPRHVPEQVAAASIERLGEGTVLTIGSDPLAPSLVEVIARLHDSLSRESALDAIPITP